jgi:hypothetical protein
MNKPDEAIDKVLAGLRDAEPSTGLGRRILEGLEHRATQRWYWNSLGNWAVAGGLALSVLAISLIASVHRGTRIAPQHPDQARPAELAAANSPAAKAIGAEPVRAPHIHRMRARVATVKAASEQGFPAPPMPLTDQEKMLLRLAHRADPAEEIAMLTPEGKAVRDAQADAEFLAFFPPPATTEEETQPMTNEKGETR